MPKNKNPITYRAYRTASLARRIRHVSSRYALISDYLEMILTNKQPLDACGFKFMYGQDQRLPEVLCWCTKNEIRVIHLVRRNVLKTIVSREIARRRGVYLATSKPQPIRVDLNTKTLLDDLKQLQSFMTYYQNMLKNFESLEIFYENFVADFDAQSRLVLDFLETDSTEKLTGKLVKTSADSLRQLIGNYNEVRDTLINSPFEELLD